MQYVLIFTFFMASGDTLIAEQEAHKNWKPLKSIEQCQKIAKSQEARMKIDIAKGNGLFVDVKIDCIRKKFRGKKR